MWGVRGICSWYRGSSTPKGRGVVGLEVVDVEAVDLEAVCYASVLFIVALWVFVVDPNKHVHSLSTKHDADVGEEPVVYSRIQNGSRLTCVVALPYAGRGTCGACYCLPGTSVEEQERAPESRDHANTTRPTSG